MAAYFAIASSPSITLALLLNASIAGFFAGYLLTRLFLTSAFRAVDLSLRGATARAEQLQAQGRHDAALNEFEATLKKLTPTASKSLRDDAFEGAIYNALYQTAPSGFEKAIRLGQEYLEQEPNEPRARILAFLAMAYGQRYAFLRASQQPNLDELTRARENVVQMMRRAIEIDPSMKELLRRVWDPATPGKSPGDDDLEIFHREQDAEIAQILS